MKFKVGDLVYGKFVTTEGDASAAYYGVVIATREDYPSGMYDYIINLDPNTPESLGHFNANELFPDEEEDDNADQGE